MRSIRLTACIASLVSGLAAPATAQSGGGWTNVQHHQSAFAYFDLGASVAAIGDLNGDQIPDMLHGSPGSNSSSMLANGKVLIRSGADGAQIDRILGVATGDRLGACVANAGDVTGDGVDDILCGAPLSDVGAHNGGTVSLYDGATRALVRSWSGADIDANFGLAVSGGVDVDGDTVPDVIVGAPDAMVNGFVGAGRAFVFSGATGALIRAHDGAAADDRLGTAVLLLEDLDGDARGDYVVGVPGSDHGPGVRAGAIEAFSGADGSSLYVRSGGTDAAEFGAALARLADRDGDLVNDFVVGAPGASGPLGAVYGAARIYLGATGAFDKQFVPPETGTRFGAAVGSAGDVDLDGVEDLVVGAPLSDNPTYTDCGTLWFVDTVSGYRRMVAQGLSNDAWMGTSVAGVGDLNGDRRSEVMGGAPGFDPWTLPGAGSVDVYAVVPWMVVDVAEVSAGAGGAIQFTIDFPASFGGDPYEIFVSRIGTGPTIRNGVKVPLTEDFVLRRIHNLPPAVWAGHDGVLDANGDATSTLPFAPGFINALIGRRMWFAAVTLAGPNSPTAASMPSPVTVLP